MKLVNKVGLFAMGLGVGVYLTIAKAMWGEAGIVINTMLVCIVICASFVAILTLGKKNQTDGKENNATD